MVAPHGTQSIRLGLVDDYEVVMLGVAHLFDRYQDCVVVLEIDLTADVHEYVDIALYDNFAQGEADQEEIGALIDSPHARRVVVYTWNFDEQLVQTALSKGASGYLSKAFQQQTWWMRWNGSTTATSS
jgi:DNA-binding NarL/FixJ family response regulator